MAIYIRDKQGELTALNIPAINGKSAYEVALSNGFEGTEQEWLKSLKGETGGSDNVYIGTAEGAPPTASMVIDPEEDNEYDGFFTNSKYDYLGKEHSTLKSVNDSNIEHVLRRVNTQKYEGSSITANNTYMKQVNNVILKGVTKFKDLETGDFIESFEEGKNLELVGARSNGIYISNTTFAYDKMIPKEWLMIGRLSGDGKGNPGGGAYGVGLKEGFYLKIIPNAYYHLSTKNIALTNFICFLYDQNKELITSKSNPYTKYPNAHYLRFYYNFNHKGDNTDIDKVVNGLRGICFIDKYINGYYNNIPPKQSSELSLSLKNPLYSIGDIYDYIDLNTGTYVKNIGIREYQEGDESNSKLLTDKKSTLYKLEEPVVSKIDLQGQKVYSYDGTTHYTCQSELGYPSPILSIEVPTDLASLVQEERAINKKLYNDQNTIIDSQLSLYESMSEMLLKDSNDIVPEYIQDLYELAYERGIRIRKQEVDINENTR